MGGGPEQLVDSWREIVRVWPSRLKFEGDVQDDAEEGCDLRGEELIADRGQTGRQLRLQLGLSTRRSCLVASSSLR
jgi:hypothetical protein